MAASSSRFTQVSTKEVDDLKLSVVPESTKQKERWATRMFGEWLKGWNPQLQMHLLTPVELNICLQFFIPSAQKEDGSHYPPRTVKEIVALIQHYYHHELKRNMSIFNDREFCESRLALDGTLKKLAQKGLVKPKKRAQAVSVEHEVQLWNEGVLRKSTPQQLLDTVIYSLGLHLSLRAGAEHRNLTFGEGSQLQLVKKNGV
jgi:hypothetical protein